ncbi:MAG: hypothetical protein P8Z80_02560 [Pseudolabrys sp.]|jgi:hypothetical protein
MIDAMTVAHELQQARTIRLAAEAACSDVEELLGEMQRGPAVWQRLALTEGGDELQLIVEAPPAPPLQSMALAA